MPTAVDDLIAETRGGKMIGDQFKPDILAALADGLPPDDLAAVTTVMARLRYWHPRSAAAWLLADNDLCLSGKPLQRPIKLLARRDRAADVLAALNAVPISKIESW